MCRSRSRLGSERTESSREVRTWMHLLEKSRSPQGVNENFGLHKRAEGQRWEDVLPAGNPGCFYLAHLGYQHSRRNPPFSSFGKFGT